MRDTFVLGTVRESVPSDAPSSVRGSPHPLPDTVFSTTVRGVLKLLRCGTSF
jgi:hypothetical protein